MTRQARHALPGFDPSAAPSRDTGGTGRSGKTGAEAGPAGSWAAVPWWQHEEPAPPVEGSAQAAPAAPAAAAAGVPAAPAQPAAVTAATPGRARPAHARRTRTWHARRTRTWTVGAIAYLAVLVCTAAGVYIAWHQGSHGGGTGGVVAGAALLVAAATRLVLPGRLAGLLASRHRLTDVLTLTVFGAGLLVAGLVLPR